MSRFLKMFALALLAFLIIVPVASAQRGGGFGGRGGFGGHGSYGGGFYGGGWGWYGPGWGWYGPYAWGYPYGYGYDDYEAAPRYGDVKITDAGKDAMVYVDGGYAGRVGDLKKFRLSVGNHDIELRDPSGHVFKQEKIDVIGGRTLEIHGNAGGQ